MKTQKQKSTRYVADYNLIIILLILSAAILSLSSIVKPSTLLGEESYYHLRIAEQPFLKYDNLSYSGRIYIFSAWPIILFLVGKLFNMGTFFASKLLPAILGLFSILLFYLILKKFNLNPLRSFVSSLILLISPPFIYLFSTSNSHAMPIFISLFSLAFILYDKKIPASILLLTLPFFGAIHSFIASVLLLIYILKSKKIFYLPISFLLFIFSIYPFFIYGLPETPKFLGLNLRILISDIGAKYGLSIFAIILSFFGLTYLWEKKYRYFSIYIALFFLIVLTFFDTKTIFYLTFMVSVLGTLGLVKMLKEKWKSQAIQKFTMFILVLGLIFSTISYTTELTNTGPTKEMIDSLIYLKSTTDRYDIILSSMDKGHYITAIAKRKNVMDANYYYAPKVNQKYNDIQKLYKTRDINEALSILNKYSIDFIWFDKETKDKILEHENEGLSFLLEYSERIKKIYKENDIEIWEVRNV